MADADLARRLESAIRAAGVPLVGVSIGRADDASTWRVHPPSAQAQAQAVIDAFDPDDPRWVEADQEAAVDGLIQSPLVEAWLDVLTDPVEIVPAIITQPSGRTIQREPQARETLRAKLRDRLRQRLHVAKGV